MPRRPAPSRHLDALLSALWPGLGQFARGRRRAALALALPPLALATAALAAAIPSDPLVLVARLVDPVVLAWLLVVQAGILAWRLVAVGDALRAGPGPWRSRWAAAGVLALLLVVVPSAYLGNLTFVARETALAVFEDDPWDGAPETPRPDDAEALGPAASPTPTPTASAGPERYTVLLIGVDSGPDRSTLLTDTMILASLDPVTGSVSMVSMPRDTVDLPLPDGRVFRRKINELVAYVRRNPGEFPDAASPQQVLADTLGGVLGVRVDAWAQVNLPGFVRVVDAVGGIDVTVTRALCDPAYDEYGFPDGFAIRPGRYHFDGRYALAYARIRKSAGESDFTRAARQQQVVVALRDRVMAGGFLADPAAFIASVGRLLAVSLEPADLVELAPLARVVDRSSIHRAVIAHPLVRSGYDVRGSIQLPDLVAIRALGDTIFPPPGTPVGTVAGTPIETLPEDGGGTGARPPALTCRAPAPAPTPTPPASAAPSASAAPTPEPSPTPTPEPTPSPTPEPTPTPTPKEPGPPR